MSFTLPDVSIVLPCYNEEAALSSTIPELAAVFLQNHINPELVLVDNGSTDSTGQVIDDLMVQGFPIRKLHFRVNQGYGGGVLAGLNACRAPVIGYLCADGQVSARDTLMAYLLLRNREERSLAKVRRKFRRDSWRRKVVSIFYNGGMQVLYQWLGAIDINGSPKFFSRRNFERMALESKDWFLDPEIMIKAKYLGLRVIEVDVEGHTRRGGTSNVNLGTCAEFVRNIFRYRFGNALQGWRRQAAGGTVSPRKRAVREAKNNQCLVTAYGLESVQVIPQHRYQDERGYVQKVLMGSQFCGFAGAGEVYVTSALPGERKGDHFHLEMGEWFAVVQGQGALCLVDTRSGERRSIDLSAADAKTVYVPAGVAHSIVNIGTEPMICVAWAEKEHDPSDVYPMDV